MILYLALFAVGGAFFWASKTRDPRSARIGGIMAALAALVALKLFKTNPALAVIALGGAGWWLWARQKSSANSGGMTREEARRVLGVSIDASREDIRAAHRRIVARVHPDVGGSADLTRQVNVARDTLMSRQA